jgi:hypothetical protein
VKKIYSFFYNDEICSLMVVKKTPACNCEKNGRDNAAAVVAWVGKGTVVRK